MGVAAHHGGIQTDSLQKIRNTLLSLRSTGKAMNCKWLAYDSADGHAGIQRRVRILKNDLHVAPFAAQLMLAKSEQINAIESYGSDIGLYKTQNCTPGRRFSATGFADET